MYGSLTAAGKELGYTQSGMTRMIRSLEKEIGFPLLVRNKQGVRPSANGQQMVPVFQEVVRASQKAADLGAAIQGVLAGVLNIGSYYSVAAAWLPAILRHFQTQYPKVEVHLLEGTNQELAQWINEKAVDCCLAAKPGGDVAYDWIPLKDDELVVWLPPDHPWTAEKEIPVEWLNGAPFVIPLPDHDTDIDRFLEVDWPRRTPAFGPGSVDFAGPGRPGYSGNVTGGEQVRCPGLADCQRQDGKIGVSSL